MKGDNLQVYISQHPQSGSFCTLSPSECDSKSGLSQIHKNMRSHHRLNIQMINLDFTRSDLSETVPAQSAGCTVLLSDGEFDPLQPTVSAGFHPSVEL